MALTKLNFYFVIVSVAILVFVGLGIIGTSFVNNDRITLNEDSLDYVIELKGENANSGYGDISDIDAGDSQRRGILDSEDNKSVDEQGDFLSTLFIKKERASEPTNFFKLVYNLPTSMLLSLKLPVSDFSNYVNIIVYLLFLVLITMIWRELRT